MIPSGDAETTKVWTSTTLALYEEPMSTQGRATSSNDLNGDRHGNPVAVVTSELSPVTGTPDNPRPMTSKEEPARHQQRIDPTIWAYIVKAAAKKARRAASPIGASSRWSG